MKESNSVRPAGYREREHTADWELEVWAPDLKGLLEQAARGMYKLAGVRLKDGARRQFTLEIPYTDAESLIVAFLSELLYQAEEQVLAFDEFSFKLSEGVLLAQLSGAPVETLDKEIKAVTYHKLQVRQTEDGLTVNIVFDV